MTSSLSVKQEGRREAMSGATLALVSTHRALYDWKVVYNSVTLTFDDDIVPRCKGAALNLAMAGSESSAVVSL